MKQMTRYLGPLHALIVRGLPDWIDERGLLKTNDLAEYLGISKAALYAQFERNRIPPKRIAPLVALSAKCKMRQSLNTQTGEPCDALRLTMNDFTEFLG